MLFSTAGIVGIRQTDGYVQTFWIGITLPLGIGTFLAAFIPSWLALASLAQGWAVLETYHWGAPLLRRILPVLWCAAPINGLFAALAL